MICRWRRFHDSRGKEFLQVALGLFDVFSGGEFPAVGEAVDVRVHRKRGHAEGLRHDDGGGLVAHARQRLKRLEVRRHLAAVLLDEDARELGNRGGLPRGEAAGADDRADFLHRDFHHVVRIVREREQRGSDLVDAHIGALRG